MIGSRRRGERSRAPPKRWVPPRVGPGNSPVASNVHRPRKYGVRSNANNVSSSHLRAGVASTIFLRSLLKPNPPPLFARDCAGDWLSATIVDADTHRNRVRVHFKGWNSRYDEWLTVTELETRAKPMQSITNARLRSKPARWVPPSGNNFGDVKAKIQVESLPARVSKSIAEANEKEMQEPATRVPRLQSVLHGDHGHINFDAGMSWKMFRAQNRARCKPYGLNSSQQMSLWRKCTMANAAAATTAATSTLACISSGNVRGKRDGVGQFNTNSKRCGDIVRAMHSKSIAKPAPQPAATLKRKQKQKRGQAQLLLNELPGDQECYHADGVQGSNLHGGKRQRCARLEEVIAGEANDGRALAPGPGFVPAQCSVLDCTPGATGNESSPYNDNKISCTSTANNARNMSKAGCRVEVKYDDGIWYPGTVMSRPTAHCLHVFFDDGEITLVEVDDGVRFIDSSKGDENSMGFQLTQGNEAGSSSRSKPGVSLQASSRSISRASTQRQARAAACQSAPPPLPLPASLRPAKDAVARQFRKSAAYCEQTSHAQQLMSDDPPHRGNQRQATLQSLHEEQCVLASGIIAWRQLMDYGLAETGGT